jgi:tRNA1(Val) A37 N6-methylase TrmN6
MLVYKVVETSIVTEEALERILNQWVPQGWEFDSIQFVIRDASKRPSMAFLFFMKKEEGRQEDESLRHDRRIE